MTTMSLKVFKQCTCHSTLRESEDSILILRYYSKSLSFVQVCHCRRGFVLSSGTEAGEQCPCTVVRRLRAHVESWRKMRQTSNSYQVSRQCLSCVFKGKKKLPGVGRCVTASMLPSERLCILLCPRQQMCTDAHGCGFQLDVDMVRG